MFLDKLRGEKTHLVIQNDTGKEEKITRPVMAAEIYKGKLFIVVNASPYPELVMFHLDRFFGEDEPEGHTLDEVYALIEEGVGSLKEIHKLSAGNAISPPKRGPGRPRKEETVREGALG